MYINKKITAILILSLFLVACGDSSGDKKSATQVVAKVNGDEISVHQLNFQMSRAGNLKAEEAKSASRQVLSNLVNRQLLVQKAKEAKLDRDPRVLQVMEASKNELLAQAYLEQFGKKAQKPSNKEIDGFYNEHPELFANRRIFRLQEIVIDAKPEQYAAIEAGVKSAKSIGEVASWIRENKYIFNVNSNVKAAEQLPANLLKLLQPLKDGEVVIIKTDKAFNVVALAASKEEPISKDKAKPFIEQYFQNKNKGELIKQELESLQKSADITYLGEFADMKDLQSSDKQPAAESEKIENKDMALSPREEASDAVKEKSIIDKGLEGL